MEKTLRPSRWVLLMLTVCVIIILSLYIKPWLNRPASVAITKIQKSDVVRVLIATGRVKPKALINVQSKITSQVKSLNVDEGAQVKMGDVIAVLDDSTLKATLAQADAAISSRMADKEQAQRDLERAKVLKAKGIVGAAQLEKAETDMKRVFEDVERLEALKQEAISRLSDAQIIAPFDGIVLSRPVDNGQVIDNKTVIFELASTVQPEVETEVDELYAAELKHKMQVKLKPAGGNKTYNGQIIYVAPKIDPRTGGRTVRVAFDASVENMLPGQSVDINVLVAKHKDALSIPRSSIASPKERPFVYVVDKAGYLKKQNIQFIDWPSASVVVETRLSEDTPIVTMAASVKEGQRIRPFERVANTAENSKNNQMFNPAE